MDTIRPRASLPLVATAVLAFVAMPVFLAVSLFVLGEVVEMARLGSRDAFFFATAVLMLGHAGVFAWMAWRSGGRLLAVRAHLRGGKGILQLEGDDLAIGSTAPHRSLHRLDSVAGAVTVRLAMPFGIPRVVDIVGRDGRQLARLDPRFYGMGAAALRGRVNALIGRDDVEAPVPDDSGIVWEAVGWSALAIAAGFFFLGTAAAAIGMNEEVWQRSFDFVR